ncbi:MAG: hypothetical protein JAZ19_08750 [Candidatus Thiodiazotropha taylori]|nr:hypothetical protein [Candidatus Thiodiazotropha taylori]
MNIKKLFKLKEWLTIDDASKYLSILFDGPVTKADVLQLGLDGHIDLSINIVNTATGRVGNIVPRNNAKLNIVDCAASTPLPRIIKKGILNSDLNKLPENIKNGLDRGTLKAIPMGMVINKNDVLEYTDEIVRITGIWDLPMIGGETHFVLQKYQALTDGPDLTLSCLEGAFLKSSEGKLICIHDKFEDDIFQSRPMSLWGKIKNQLLYINILSNSNITDNDDGIKEDSNTAVTKPNTKDYYPTGELPNDSVLVVRANALREFEQRQINSAAPKQKALKTNERNSLLTIIAALCNHTNIDPDGRGVAVHIAKMTEKIGAPVSDDTVRRVLEKIPDAIESRIK